MVLLTPGGEGCGDEGEDSQQHLVDKRDRVRGDEIDQKQASENQEEVGIP
jgi:hypothetical protein